MTRSVENFSPMQKIKSVLVSPPGVEASLASLYPEKISLFETEGGQPVSIIESAIDHLRMEETFKEKGIEVLNMRYIIGNEFANNIMKNKPLLKQINTIEKLETDLTRRAETIYGEYKKKKTPKHYDLVRQEIHQLLQKDLELFNNNEKAVISINALLSYCMDINGQYVEFNVKDKKYPMGNQTFWRDTNHISGKSMGMHKMHFPIRQPEVNIAKIGMDALGIPYYQINCKGSIEGGDILPMEINRQRYALIGQAERTTKTGAHEWFKFHAQEFFKEDIIPLLIRGPKNKTQTEMHLDTYAQQINEKGIIHCAEITKNREVFLLAQKPSGTITEIPRGKFYDFIRNNFTYQFEMTKQEQLDYAPNVLVDGGRNTVFFTRKETPRVDQFVKELIGRDNVIILDMPNFTKLYGGAHCSTSEVR